MMLRRVEKVCTITITYTYFLLILRACFFIKDNIFIPITQDMLSYKRQLLTEYCFDNVFSYTILLQKVR